MAKGKTKSKTVATPRKARLKPRGKGKGTQPLGSLNVVLGGRVVNLRIWASGYASADGGKRYRLSRTDRDKYVALLNCQR